jgi:hypothetical protein
MERITSLPEGHIFVFGSNEAGIHGAGAAKDALNYFGAVYGNGSGHVGQSYAIPTKDGKIRTLPLSDIDWYIEWFNEYTKTHSKYTFHVTPIGTGLAGYSVCEIADLFQKYEWLDNIVWPDEFIDHPMKTTPIKKPNIIKRMISRFI